VCEKPFKNGQYFASDKKPYCEEHYLQLTCEKCDTCRKPIVDEASAIRIGAKAHHPGCLSCSHCGIKPTVKGSIYQKDGKVYCQVTPIIYPPVMLTTLFICIVCHII
jgi:hypothetical protein